MCGSLLLYLWENVLVKNSYWTVYKRRRVWRYQRGNQNPYIEEEQTTQWPKEKEQTTQWPKEKEQTTQWPKEKVQKDKQRSTKHAYKNKDGVTRTPLKTGGELRCSRRVSSSCSWTIDKIYVHAVCIIDVCITL